MIIIISFSPLFVQKWYLRCAIKICATNLLQADRPQVTTFIPPRGVPEDGGGLSTRPTLKIALLGSEWNSSTGGLSTFNRELVIHLSKLPTLDVTLLVPKGACTDKEKRDARSYGVTVVDAEYQPGVSWLSFPPKDLYIDMVVGQGMELGRQGQITQNFVQFNNCKWVQVVHTAPEDLGKFKDYSDPTSKGETKHQVEVELCKRADLVVSVGSRLAEMYSLHLRHHQSKKDIISFTPGLFEREFGDLEHVANSSEDFKVLMVGRGDAEDFELMGYKIAFEAFTDQRLKKKPYQLIFVGAPEGKQEELKERLLRCGIAKKQLTVRKFVESRDRMRDLLCEADLAIMPSKSEGFGLFAVEALSAGLPILVGSRSGFAKALGNVPSGDSCIVNSDDPAKWAEAIEAVRVRHRMRLTEIKALKASYGMIYCWKEQCKTLVERMWQIVHGMSCTKYCCFSGCKEGPCPEISHDKLRATYVQAVWQWF